MLVAPEGREQFAMATLAICSGASFEGQCIHKKNQAIPPWRVFIR